METRNGDSSALDNLLRRNRLSEEFVNDLKSYGKKGYLKRYAELVMDNTKKQDAAQKARQDEEASVRNDDLKVSPSSYDGLFNDDNNERLDAIKVKYDIVDETLKESREILEQVIKYVQEYYSREQVMVHIANGWGYIGLDPETQEFSDPKFTIDDCDSYCFDDDSGIPVGAKRSGLTEDDIDDYIYKKDEGFENLLNQGKIPEVNNFIDRPKDWFTEWQLKNGK